MKDLKTKGKYKKKSYFIIYFLIILIFLLSSCNELQENFQASSSNETQINQLINEGKYQKAIKKINSLINEEPSSWEYYFLRGYCYFQLNIYSDAISNFDSALAFSNDPKIYNLRGIANYYLGNYEIANQDFSKSIELEPDVADLYIWRAKTYLHINLTEGMDDLNYAIELSPTSGDGYLWRGIYYANMQECKTAIEDLNIAVDILDNYMAYHWRGFAHFCNHEDRAYEKMLSDLQQAIKLDDSHAIDFEYLGYYYWSQDNNEMMLDSFTRAIELEPDNPKYYEWRSRAYYIMGMDEEAEKDHEKRMELLK